MASRATSEAAAAKTDGAIAKDANLAAILAEVEKLSADITTAIKADKISTSLEDTDTKRDELIRSLFTLLLGYAAIPLADKKAAAEKLLAVTEKYKGITSEAYARESSLIESMLEDFAADTLADPIKALDGVGDLISALRTAQDDFKEHPYGCSTSLLTQTRATYSLATA